MILVTVRRGETNQGETKDVRFVKGGRRPSRPDAQGRREPGDEGPRRAGAGSAARVEHAQLDSRDAATTCRRPLPRVRTTGSGHHVDLTRRPDRCPP